MGTKSFYGRMTHLNRVVVALRKVWDDDDKKADSVLHTS
jgi:hypothetical protein